MALVIQVTLPPVFCSNICWTASCVMLMYPRRFVSDSFPLVRMNHGGDLDGMLTLRGIEHPVHMTIDASDCDDPLRGDCAVEAWGSINRSQFGMHSRHGALSDKVQLRFSAFVEKHDPDRGS